MTTRKPSGRPQFFATPAQFRAWLAKNHGTATELLVGFRKKSSGLASITWPESVDEALCFGWIDGVRRSLGADSYTIRFTPRREKSTWSSVNIRRVEALSKQGRMRPAGLAAFARRSQDRSAIYAYEQRDRLKLAPAEERRFRAERTAWTFFRAQAPSYRKNAIHWVVSAKKAETRERRLTTLIADCAAGKRIGPLRRPGEA